MAPFYMFENIKTGIKFEKMMKYEEMLEYIKENKDKVRPVYKLNIKRDNYNFRKHASTDLKDRIKEIKKAHKHSTINTTNISEI